MTIKTILTTAEKFVTDNSPGILTGLGVAGAVTTAILAGKAGYSTALLLQTDYAKAGGEPSRKQEVQIVWKEYIPAVIAGTATITCIIAANSIGSRRTAAITAAFKLSEHLSEEYKDKVVKTLGLQKEEKMRSELAAEKMNANPPAAGMIIVAGSDVLFLDELSGRYFQSQVDTVKKAVNEINHKVNNYFHASLTDFYELIGLEGTSFSNAVGWNSDELLEIQITPTMYGDKPAILLGYNHGPIIGYDRLH